MMNFWTIFFNTNIVDMYMYDVCSQCQQVRMEKCCRTTQAHDTERHVRRWQMIYCGLYRWGREEWSFSKGRRRDMSRQTLEKLRQAGMEVSWMNSRISELRRKTNEEITHWHRKSTLEATINHQLHPKGWNSNLAMNGWGAGSFMLQVFITCSIKEEVCVIEQVKVVRVEVGTATQSQRNRSKGGGRGNTQRHKCWGTTF